MQHLLPQRHYGSLVQIVNQRDIVLPLSKGLLVDANSREWIVGLTGLSTRRGLLKNGPCFIPSGTQQNTSSFDSLCGQENVDSKPHEHECKPTTLLCPRNRNRFDAMLRAIHSRLPGDEACLELAGVEMTPSTLLGMVVARQFGLTFRATKLRSSRMIDLYPNLRRSSIEFNIGDFPR